LISSAKAEADKPCNGVPGAESAVDRKVQKPHSLILSGAREPSLNRDAAPLMPDPTFFVSAMTYFVIHPGPDARIIEWRESIP
jgi:hypothetical protein